MRNLLLFLSVILITSCSPEKTPTEIILSGKIINPKGSQFKLTGSNESYDILVAPDGTFSDTLEIPAGYYSFRYNNEFGSIYLKPGYNLSLSLDTDLFDETLAYTGVGANENNFIASKTLKQESEVPAIDSLYKFEEQDFLAIISNFKDGLTKDLSSLEMDDDFKKMEEKNINYDFLSSLQNYPVYHKHFAQNAEYVVSEGFLDPINAISMDDSIDFEQFAVYRNIIKSNFVSKFNEKDNAADILSKLGEYKSQNVKNLLVKELGYYISPNKEDVGELYEGIMAAATDEDFKQKLTEKFEKIKLLVAGKEAPKFSFNNVAGKAVALDDLKGKLVYVDVWATWCGPCKREIPMLKELEKAYHSKGIEFVSISIDKMGDYQTWLDMVKDLDLKGIQLFADKDWESDFVKQFAIEGIPRFILIDQEGKIISADAPRPSSGDVIKALIDENLKS